MPEICEYCEHCGEFMPMFPYNVEEHLVICPQCETVYLYDEEGNLHEKE